MEIKTEHNWFKVVLILVTILIFIANIGFSQLSLIEGSKRSF